MRLSDGKPLPPSDTHTESQTMSRILLTTAVLMAAAAPVAAQTTRPKLEPPLRPTAPTPGVKSPKPVAPPAELADLVVADIRIEEDKNRVTLTVRNQGTIPATNFQVRMQLLGTAQVGRPLADQSKSVAELRTGGSTQLSFDVVLAGARSQFPNGGLIIRGIADGSNLVPEKVETNNRLDRPLLAPQLREAVPTRPKG